MNTVAAIITPLGTGGIGVVRISGEDAQKIADKVFKTKSGKKIEDLMGYSALFGKVYNGDNLIDEAVALNFVAPKSFTGENCVELSVHGGSFVVKELLNAVLSAGAKMAEPGEFTKRAFLNGKLDLTQAESVMGIISARSAQDLKIQQDAKSGAVSGKVAKIKQELIVLAANIAAFTDYPDEDLPEISMENITEKLAGIKTELEALIKNYNAGAVLKNGIKTVITGSPNVGKSTLMNMLSGVNRSIVTDIAGTTRDVIEQTVMIGDIPLLLCDTAGIRETSDAVEAAGVNLAKEYVSNAQLILAVFDGSKQISEQDKTVLENANGIPVIVVINKTDLEQKITPELFKGYECVMVSAKNAKGYSNLRAAIEKVTGVADLNADAVVLGSLRQKDCASRALNSINDAQSALCAGFTLDAVGVCIDDALYEMLSLTGERVTNEVTNEVFRRFCVGK